MSIGLSPSIRRIRGSSLQQTNLPTTQQFISDVTVVTPRSKRRVPRTTTMHAVRFVQDILRPRRLCRESARKDDPNARLSLQWCWAVADPSAPHKHARGVVLFDGEMLFEHGTITEIIVQRHAGVIDEDIEQLDVRDCFLNLGWVSHVQDQGRDAPIRVGEEATRACIHMFRAPPQRLVDQCLS
jgi:hypothetical protein